MVLRLSSCILGIVSGMAVSNYRKYRESAYDIQVVALSRNLATAGQVICSELEEKSSEIEAYGNPGSDYHGGNNDVGGNCGNITPME